MAQALVAAVKTTPKTVLDDYRRLMHLSGYQQHLSKDIKTILKLNLSWSLYYPACSTEPWQLEGVLRTLREDGFQNLTAMENRTVVTKIDKGVTGNKWKPVMEKYSVPFQPLTGVAWGRYEIKAETPFLDAIYGDTHTIPLCFKGCNVLHLPTVKTHGHTTTTGAMKNAFGGLITVMRHHSHKQIHGVLVDLLKIQKEIHPGIFAAMDGAVCGNGRGPRTMQPVAGNVLLASADQVAIDAISAKIMGFDPLKIHYIKMAHDEGLGCGDPDQIEIAGDDIKALNFGFKTGKSMVVWGDQLFRKGALSFVEPLLFHTPLFNLCIAGSYLYHDWFWYPTVGKSKIRQFNKTEWGQLFQQY